MTVSHDNELQPHAAVLLCYLRAEMEETEAATGKRKMFRRTRDDWLTRTNLTAAEFDSAIQALKKEI